MHARGHRRQGARRDAGRDGPVCVVAVQEAGPVGAHAREEGRAEIDLAGEAEQQVPRHGEDGEIEGRASAGRARSRRRRAGSRGEQRSAQPRAAAAVRISGGPAGPAAADRPQAPGGAAHRHGADRDRRDQVGRSASRDVADHIGRGERARDAAEAAQHHDRERARGERARRSRKLTPRNVPSSTPQRSPPARRRSPRPGDGCRTARSQASVRAARIDRGREQRLARARVRLISSQSSADRRQRDRRRQDLVRRCAHPRDLDHAADQGAHRLGVVVVKK